MTTAGGETRPTPSREPRPQSIQPSPRCTGDGHLPLRARARVGLYLLAPCHLVWDWVQSTTMQTGSGPTSVGRATTVQHAAERARARAGPGRGLIDLGFECKGRFGSVESDGALRWVQLPKNRGGDGRWGMTWVGRGGGRREGVKVMVSEEL